MSTENMYMMILTKCLESMTFDKYSDFFEFAIFASVRYGSRLHVSVEGEMENDSSYFSALFDPGTQLNHNSLKP